MAVSAHRASTDPAKAGWIEHDGRGRPVPLGTLVDVRRFNGDVDRLIAGAGPTVAADGSRIDSSRARWSGWDHFDGGPMPVKFRAYRVVVQIGSPEQRAIVTKPMLAS